MMPALLQQFRLYYDSGDAAPDGPAGGGLAFGTTGHPQAQARSNAPKPIGVVFWAEVDAEVASRLAEGVTQLRPHDWTSGRAAAPDAGGNLKAQDNSQLWVVEVIAPFGGAEDMVRELKQHVFPTREVRYPRVGPQGKRVEVV